MNKTALITGATSGIGLELAKLFAKDKYNLVIVSRDQSSLDVTKKILEDDYSISVITICQNLSEKNSAQTIYETTKSKGISIDALVNNAGIGVYGLFQNTDLEKETVMIELNVTALTTLTKVFLPEMLNKRAGKILNVASTAAFQPGPGMAVYFATKAYVLSFSEALHEELRGTGVSVTTLCPGPTKTNFDVNAGAEHAKIFTGRGIMTAKTVAQIGYDAMMRNKMTVVAGFKNAIFVFLVRLTPRQIVPRIVRWIQGE
jgi:short-subunit dehydrogenase